MKKRVKRFLAFLLVVSMVLGDGSLSVFAEEFSDEIGETILDEGFIDADIPVSDDVFTDASDSYGNQDDFILEQEEIILDSSSAEENDFLADDYFTDETAEELTFESGYVRVKKDTIVYDSTLENEIGKIIDDAYVYGAVMHYDIDLSNDWLKIVFDTNYSRDNNQDLFEGYVSGNRVDVLSEEETIAINNSITAESNVRAYLGKGIPVVQYEDYLQVEEQSLELLNDENTQNESSVQTPEIVDEDTVETQTEETTVEETTEEISEEEETVVDQPVDAVDDEEAQTEMVNESSEEAITTGYLKLTAGVIVYTTEKLDEELGTIDADSTVYAEIVETTDSKVNRVYKILFKTEDGRSYEGYIDGTGFEFAEVVNEDKEGELVIPVISFTERINGLTDGLWVYEIADGYAKVLGYLDYDVEKLSIPDTLGGHYVNAIGDKAFVKNTKLSDIYVHGNVISIADDAFASKNVKLSGYNGTKVLSYATKNGMPSMNMTNVEHFEFQEHVIDYTYADNSRYEYSGNNVIKMSAAEAAQLSAGSIFYVPEMYQELVTIYKVESIDGDGDWCLINVSEASAEESIVRMVISDESLYADWSSAEWADGIELVDEKLDFHGTGSEGSISFNIKKDLGKGFEGSFSVTGSIGAKADLDVHCQ